jgi:hypothetical protein
MAVLREPAAGACSWDALRVLSAANDQPVPSPSAGLVALLGKPCQRCQTAFQADRVAARERAMLAAASSGPAPTGVIWPAGAEPAALVAAAREHARRKANPPAYYRRGRP